MTAFLRTMAARLGTTLAMVIFMLAAFVGASIANLGTETADLTDEMGAAAHEGDADTARFRAIEADARAVRPVAQALVRTMVAFLGTLATSLDARLMMLMGHKTPLYSIRQQKSSGLWCKDDAGDNFLAALFAVALLFEPAYQLLSH